MFAKFFAKIFFQIGVLGVGASFPKFLESNASAYMLGFFAKILKFFTVLINISKCIYKTSVFLFLRVHCKNFL